MKIGIDVDGVLADFISAYQTLIIKATGRNLFQPGDIDNPPCWDWPEMRGYEKVEMDNVWALIMSDPNFWFGLHPLKDAATLAMHWDEIDEEHEVSFITNRPGLNVRKQTEEWLSYFLAAHDSLPHVIVVGKNAKGDVCKHMGLDIYVDDAYDNAVDVVQKAKKTRGYLVDRSYNKYDLCSRKKLAYGEAAYSELQAVESRRVCSMEEFLLAEHVIAGIP